MKNRIIITCTLLLAIATSCTQQSKTEENRAVQACDTAVTVKDSITTAPVDTVYPEFPGGEEALKKYFKVNELNKKIEGYEIDKDGKICNIVLDDSFIDKAEYNTDFLSKIDSMPQWKPGTVGGKPTRFCYYNDDYDKISEHRCVNIGEDTEKHKLIGEWTLINRQGEGVKMHPVYKSNMHITMIYNFRFQMLHQIGRSESRLYDTEIFTTKNEFTLVYNDSTRITYRYSLNESGDILKTYYTDVNGKEQELTWIKSNNLHSNFMRLLFPGYPVRAIFPGNVTIDTKDLKNGKYVIEKDAGIVKLSCQYSQITPDKDLTIKTKEITKTETADKDSIIYQVVEKQPEFPGGMKALMKYLRENMKYPVECRKKNIQGKSFVSFIVKMDGSIENVEIIRSSGDELLDKEAIRVVTTMPKWIPGKEKGETVNVRFTLPVTFKL